LEINYGYTTMHGQPIMKISMHIVVLHYIIDCQYILSGFHLRMDVLYYDQQMIEWKSRWNFFSVMCSTTGHPQS